MSERISGSGWAILRAMTDGPRPRRARLLTSSVAALFGLGLTASGCSDECERQSDCAPDELCTGSGECVPRTPQGGGTRLDGGGLDLSFPDAGIDAGSPDAGLDGGPDLGLDGGTGDGGAGDAGGLADEAFVRVRQLQSGAVDQARIEGRLQNRSLASYRVFEQTFFLADGSTCRLRDVILVAGSPIGYLVDEIRVTPMGGMAAPISLFGSAIGVYTPVVIPPGLFAPRGTSISFEMTAASPGTPADRALEGLDPVEVMTPIPVEGLVPSPSVALDLEVSNSFQWLPSGIPGTEVVFLFRTVPDGDLSLRCGVMDVGLFAFSPEVGAAFADRRFGRSAELLVVRTSSSAAEVPRRSGGTLTVGLEVQVGTRYSIR